MTFQVIEPGPERMPLISEQKNTSSASFNTVGSAALHNGIIKLHTSQRGPKAHLDLDYPAAGQRTQIQSAFYNLPRSEQQSQLLTGRCTASTNTPERYHPSFSKNVLQNMDIYSPRRLQPQQLEVLEFQDLSIDPALP